MPQRVSQHSIAVQADEVSESASEAPMHASHGQLPSIEAMSDDDHPSEGEFELLSEGELFPPTHPTIDSPGRVFERIERAVRALPRYNAVTRSFDSTLSSVSDYTMSDGQVNDGHRPNVSAGEVAPQAPATGLGVTAPSSFSIPSLSFSVASEAGLYQRSEGEAGTVSEGEAGSASEGEYGDFARSTNLSNEFNL